jgi:quercetin dioxygenase-like cupin family protein
MTVEAISHHFSDGVYAKQMFLEKGHVARTHKHVYSHLSILAQGEVVIALDGLETLYKAPCCIEIKAEVEHQIKALQDSVFFCVHATEITDLEHIDEVLIVKD